MYVCQLNAGSTRLVPGREVSSEQLVVKKVLYKASGIVTKGRLALPVRQAY